ncbi:MAG TPA: hypothetical protein VMS93_07125, partial [Candidatus Saccharimonadales bacterium]|nr:hypothetical protein [Candidatus Saccharimonadales bacterium]
ALGAGIPAARGAPPQPLQALGFLLGDWEGAGAGQPGAGGGVCSFAPGLQDQLLVRTSYAEYPATPQRPASRHDDLMVIYAADSTHVRADYWDSEGHVIRYAVTASGGREAVFLSDAVAGAPRYRLTYTLSADSTIAGRFEVAPPGQPAAFTPYLAWTLRRLAPAAGAADAH